MRNEMTVEERIQRCILLEKMENNKEYSKKIGLENKSIIKGAGQIGKEKLKDS